MYKVGIDAAPPEHPFRLQIRGSPICRRPVSAMFLDHTFSLATASRRTLPVGLACSVCCQRKSTVLVLKSLVFFDPFAIMGDAISVHYPNCLVPSLGWPVHQPKKTRS